MDIQQIITYIVGSIATIAAAWLAKKAKDSSDKAKEQEANAKVQEEKAKKSEQSVKRIGQKIDIITVILMGMFHTERELYGYNHKCGSCDGEHEKCSRQYHSRQKLNMALSYIQDECEKHELPFDYGFCYSKIHEFMFILNRNREK